MSDALLVLPLHAVSSLQYSSLISCPPELAARMIEKADIQPGQRRLDLEADTGNLIVATADIPGEIGAVEINAALVAQLRRRWDDGSVDIRLGDFLTCDGDLGTFDRIVMNPP